MKRALVLFAVAAAASFFAARPAWADIISVGVVVGATSVNSGDTGFFDVTLTNNGSDIFVGGFSFGVSVDDLNLTFLQSTIDTAQPYIFASDSFDILTLGLTSIETTTGGQTLVASDLDNSGLGITVGSGATVGLGRVFFQIAGGAPSSVITVTATAYPTTGLSDPAYANIDVSSLSDGQISVTGTAGAVPEPATMNLFILAMCVWGVTEVAKSGRVQRRGCGSRK